MFCGKCGSEMKDNARFCPKCGAPVPGYEVSINEIEKINEAEGETTVLAEPGVMQPVDDVKKQPTTPNKPNKPPRKPISKKTKLAIIISSVSVVVVAAIVSCILLLGGRSKKKAVDKFETAFNEENDDKLLKLMYPKECHDNADELAEDGRIMDLITWNEELKEEAGDITVSIKDTQDIDSFDDALRSDVENELLNKLSVEYSEIVVASLEVSFSDADDMDELCSVVMYKIDKTWYILPGAIELIVDDRKKDDIENAERIKDTVNMCLANEDAYDSMEPYLDVVVSLDELDYMPQAFQDVFNDDLGEIPVIRHKSDGATGFAFMIDEYYSVYVYISSDESINEWEIAPNISDRYDIGEKSSGSEMIAPSDYSYVKLISEKSPILGYWQADNAAMYIGYDVSGGNEGLTVYSTEGETIIHTYNGYAMSGGNQMLRYESTHDWNSKNFVINVIDDENIEMIYSNYDSGEDITYTYTKGEITDDALDRFVGVWIPAYEDLDVNSISCELIHCESCGFVHDINVECPTKDKCVSLCTDDKLMYIFPDEGLKYYDGGVGYNLIYYALEGDKMTDNSARIGGGGGVAYSYYREGSSLGDISKILAAYYNYAGDIESKLGYNMADIDGDGVPECIVYNDEWGGSGGGYARVLTYKNDQVYSCENNYTTTSIYIKSGDNDFCMKYYGSMSELEGLTIYGISDDGFSQKADCYHYFDESAEDFGRYYVNGEETNLDNYNSYVDSLGSYNTLLDADYSSIADAYDAYSGN